jgi:hypothetical protein
MHDEVDATFAEFKLSGTSNSISPVRNTTEYGGATKQSNPSIATFSFLSQCSNLVGGYN